MERLEKNFLWLSAANIVGSLFGALLVIYLARVLEAEYFGYLSYATAIVFYLFNFVDLGLSTYGIREVAKDPSGAGEYVSNIVSFKLMVAGILFTAFVALCFFTTQPPIIKFIMVEAALMLFASALATEWAFQGMEKMRMVFVSFAVTTFLQLMLSIFFVKGPADILRVPLITFIGSLPIVVTFLWHFRFRFRLSRIDFNKIKIYLSSSMVIWAISVFAQAYNGLDIVILGFFRAPAEIGCFTVARRIVGGVAVLMILLANAVLPRLSSTFAGDIAQFRRATAKFLRVSIFMVILIFVPLVLFSGQIISLTVGSEYISASVPLRIMACALVLVMFNLPYSTGLIAARFEKDVLKQVFVSASLSVILNFALMPKYGMIGASVSFLSAELLALIWILVIYHKRIRLLRPM
jgi:Membrane protein involved in the export of O-antigen and teichoic acid